jgi:hypothetical protein
MYIRTFVGYVTRYPEAVALSTIYTEATMLGYPDEILSDQDLNFTSQFLTHYTLDDKE